MLVLWSCTVHGGGAAQCRTGSLSYALAYFLTCIVSVGIVVRDATMSRVTCHCNASITVAMSGLHHLPGCPRSSAVGTEPSQLNVVDA
jgi:hypothetical protein